METEQREFEVKLTLANKLILDRYDKDWRDLHELQGNKNTLLLDISVEENFGSDYGTIDEYGRSESIKVLNHTAYFDQEGNELESDIIDILDLPCGVIG